VATANAPSVVLPMAFALTGLAALLFGMGWVTARPSLLATYHYNQSVIAATHLFVLGWLCTVVMGSMYQLVPVALETRLYSERLAAAQFVCHVVGFAGMVWMFSTWNMKQVGHFGSLLTFGVGLFVYNLGRTLKRVPKWNVTAFAVMAALIWISLTVLAGLSIATAKCAFEAMSDSDVSVSPLIHGLRSVAGFVGRFDAISAMHAHAHLGAVGCFTMLLVGVSYKLIPMFTLSEVQSRRRAVWSIGLLNVGLVGTFLTVLLRSPWKLAFGLVIVAALALYGWELLAILRVRKRKALDWGIKYFLTAVALFAPLGALGMVLTWPGLPLTPLTGQLENVYGFLGLIGVVTLAIIGMLYKIIPFLVWFGRYSKHVGRARVPALADLYSGRVQAAGYFLYMGGLAVTVAGIIWPSETLVRFGCGFLTLSAASLAWNVGIMLSHFFNPKVQPLRTEITPN
jgi:cbb3-type cytochrome oxidase subunit 1